MKRVGWGDAVNDGQASRSLGLRKQLGIGRTRQSKSNVTFEAFVVAFIDV